MAQFDVVDMNGKKVSTVELSDAVFGITPNEKAVHEAVVNFLANQRQGTQNTKIRKEVRGGGKKPWRQKGTGHARQGSIRAPQWTHGGVALGPKPRSYYYTINKKVKRLALLSALSDKAANGNMILVDKIAADEYKTKTVVAFLAAVGAGKKNLIVNDTLDAKFVKSAANIPGVDAEDHLPRALLVVQGGVLVHHIRQVRLVRDKAVHKGKQLIPLIQQPEVIAVILHSVDKFLLCRGLCRRKACRLHSGQCGNILPGSVLYNHALFLLVA